MASVDPVIHAVPTAVDERTSPAALRAIATVEAVKGIAVLALGVTLLFVHRHAEDFASSLLFHLHMDPERRLPQLLLHAATKVTDARLLTIALAMTVYSTVRFVEGWGLWHRRVWAEWFALLSGAMYLPFELLKLVERTDWERVTVLIINVAVILYMLWIRIRDCGVLLGKCKEDLLAEGRPLREL